MEVRFHERIREKNGVFIQARRIQSVTTMDGKQWAAKIFIDCSYEGDLLAQSGVPYVVAAKPSRSSTRTSPVCESRLQHITWPVSAYDASHTLLREIDPGPLGGPGCADKKVQAYNFRPILTHSADDRLPWLGPDRYDPTRFALLARYLGEFAEHRGHTPNLRDVTNPALIPNGTADFNNNGPFSTDYIGHSWLYPDATYAQKQAIWDDTLNYIQDFFYFLSQDPARLATS